MCSLNGFLAPSAAADVVEGQVDISTPEPANRASKPAATKVGKKRRKIFSGLKQVCKRIARVLRRQGHRVAVVFTEPPEENCWRHIEVTHVDRTGEHVARHAAYVLFDTGCRPNLVTEKWLRNNGLFHLVNPTVIGGEDINVTSKDGTKSRVIGHVTLDVYAKETPHKRQLIFLKDSTMTCDFVVVTDKAYDLIIGLETIKDECLFGRDREIPFFGETQGGFTSSAKASEDERRKDAKDAQQAKKAEQKAAKTQPSGNGNASSR